MPPLNILRPATMATLIGLLYATGIRIGEAMALNIGDLDPRHSLLSVVRGKFGKSRNLPLRESTSSALVRYIEDSHRPIGTRATAPLFVSSLKRRLAQPTASGALTAVCQRAELSKPWPRPHDFRHTFAISCVAAWYAEGRNVESLLPILSTYLGHSSVENTRLYLTANGALLEQASARFAYHTRVLDEVST
jgi:integrase